MYVCVYIYVCIYVCVYIRMYICCMYVYICVYVIMITTYVYTLRSVNHIISVYVDFNGFIVY